MSKKVGNFFEEHIEKIVLAVVGLVCLWLLFSRVLISPNYVEYDNDKFGPGDIDDYISRQAEVLEDKLNRRPEPREAYEPRLPAFDALVDSAISGIDVSVSLPQPIVSSRDVRDDRRYRIPRIGEVNEVGVEHIRTVAYVPTEVINEENPYSAEVSEPNDIDLVTVEARFDVAGLYERFNDSFAGDNVQEQWRDASLAVPIFAAVQLQRQELLGDGSWSEWQIVPRTRVDFRKRMFEVIEEVERLEAGGIKVRLLQFDDAEVKMDLLQPQAYRIASAKEEWLPPSLHKKFVKFQRDIAAEERRAARVVEMQQREQERSRAREGRSRTSRTRTRLGMDLGEEGDTEDFDSDRFTRKTSTRKRERGDRWSERERSERSKETPKPASTGDVYNELSEVLITRETDFGKMREPLLFWAHDDTVEPEKSYRYRIRLGVFNPIAGTNQFSEQDKSLKDKVILWSKFSDVTEPVKIPGTLYFFPFDIQEATKAVTVRVCRYVLGYWYSKAFTVKRGEVIGKVVESEAVDVADGVLVPETIDYATGAVLVDVIAVNDWSGTKNLRARHYFDMLYSFDGTSIEHMPIKTRYWAEELQAKFSEIKKSEKEPKEPLRAWGSRPEDRQRLAPGLEFEDEFMDEEGM